VDICIKVVCNHYCFYNFILKGVFGLEKKVWGKIVKGKIVEGMNVDRKWEESVMFFDCLVEVKVNGM